MLYIVGTPIGNLEDITLRAVRILKEVDLIACEDTRRSKTLLNHYQISTPLVSYHQHSKLQKINHIIEQLLGGKNIALISDAGTPGINDPGGILVSEAIKNNIKVVPIPGVSALTSTLSIWGFEADDFLYLGFLPKKKGRQTLFRNLMKTSALKLYKAIVLYESPYHLARTLVDLQLTIGNKDVLVARELTKVFEESVRGKIADVIQYFQTHPPKGEIVIIIKN